MSGPPPPATPTQRFVGHALIAVGWLIITLAGLCTGIVLVVLVPGVFAGPKQSIGDLIAQALYPVLVGGGPILIGVALVFIGRGIVRRP